MRVAPVRQAPVAAPAPAPAPAIPARQTCGDHACAGGCDARDEERMRATALAVVTPADAGEPPESPHSLRRSAVPVRPAGAAATRASLDGDDAVADLERRGEDEEEERLQSEGGGRVTNAAADAPAALGSLVLDDDVLDVPRGALRRTEFLDALEVAVRTAADAELRVAGRTTEGCPYIEQWLGYYRERSAAHVERAVRRYARDARTATTAAGYVEAVSSRVRASVATWARSGVVSGVPDELSSAARQTLASGDPGPVRAALGRGEPLDAGTRSRMESAFGHDFGRVRVHTGAAGARVASAADARALAVGSDVAFAAGEYRPGTVAGDALIAHELAHTVQQDGDVHGRETAPGDDAAYERDADRSAVAAVMRLWGRTTAAAKDARPSLRSGLALRGCRSRRGCEVASGPTYSPTGTIPVTTSGSTKTSARFSFTASFTNAPSDGKVPACCEVRQYIKWDERFHRQAGGPPHTGFPSSATWDTWYEDRSDTDLRYGHRSGSHSFVGAGCNNEYKTGGSTDMANGDTYCGWDQPSGFATDVGKYDFQLKVVDTCNGNAEKASSSIVTVNWG